jgi:hypothetical protein
MITAVRLERSYGKLTAREHNGKFMKDQHWYSPADKQDMELNINDPLRNAFEEECGHCNNIITISVLDNNILKFYLPSDH